MSSVESGREFGRNRDGLWKKKKKKKSGGSIDRGSRLHIQLLALLFRYVCM